MFLDKYLTTTPVDWYIYLTKDELESNYNQLTTPHLYTSIKDYVEKYYGTYNYKLNGNLDLLSNKNPNGFIDYYRIGGIWDGHICDITINPETEDCNKNKLEHNIIEVKNYLNRIIKQNNIMVFNIISETIDWFHDDLKTNAFLELLENHKEDLIVGIDVHY